MSSHKAAEMGGLRPKYMSLQIGRGAAALLVVAHHGDLAARAFSHASSPLSGVFSLGYLGVDFFFVLSGFIIYVTSTGSKADTGWVRQYVASRITRVFVPYLPVAAALIGLYILRIVPDSTSRTWDVSSTLTLMPTNHLTALNVAWTLRHELVFYAVFALFKFIGRPIAGLTGWSIIIAVVAIAGIKYPYFMSFFLSPLNIEFLFGVVVGAISSSSAAPIRRVFTSRNAGALCVSTSFCALLLFGYLGSQRVLSPIIGLAFALVLVPIVGYEAAMAPKFPKSLVFIGNASYAIYLVHDPAISLAARVMAPFGYYPILAGGTLLGVILGILYHVAWERPVLLWMRAARGQ